MRFTKKPITIDAMRWAGSDKDAVAVVMWILKHGGKAHYQSEPRTHASPERGVYEVPPHIVIETLEGEMKLWAGDYAIKGIKGEFYPHAGSFFLEAYEPAEEEL